jgi:hypothetical protein
LDADDYSTDMTINWTDGLASDPFDYAPYQFTGDPVADARLAAELEAIALDLDAR